MIDSKEMIGTFIKLPKKTISKLRDYQVLIGFSGFGNVGYLTLTHLVETLDLESIAFWGNSSWYHRGNIESLLTVYKHKQSKTIIVLPRIPIHVSTISQRYWDQLAQDVLNWNCAKYIVVGGLREETRTIKSGEWAALVPTPNWTENFGDKRTFGDHLAMIGPLSSFLILGTALNLSVLGLLAYCNFEEDPEAALFAVTKIENLCNMTISQKNHLQRFDYSFIPGGQIPGMFNALNNDDTSLDEDDDEDDIPGYDLSDLV